MSYNVLFVAGQVDVEVQQALPGGHPRLVTVALYLYLGHPFEVNSITWSPDSKYLAVVGGGKVILWEVARGKVIYTYSGHVLGAKTVAWSPTFHQLLASGGEDASLHIWKFQQPTSLERLLLKGTTARSRSTGVQGPIHALAWSPDGRAVLMGAGDTLRLVTITPDLNAWISPEFQQSHQQQIQHLAWSPSSDLAVSLDKDNVCAIWHVAQRKLLHVYRSSELITCLAWSPDGTHLAVGKASGTIQVWLVSEAEENTVKHSLIAQFEHGAPARSLSWCPGLVRGRPLIASGDAMGAVVVWHAASGQIVCRYTLRSESQQSIPVTNLMWSPSGGHLAISGEGHVLQVLQIPREVRR